MKTRLWLKSVELRETVDTPDRKKVTKFDPIVLLKLSWKRIDLRTGMQMVWILIILRWSLDLNLCVCLLPIFRSKVFFSFAWIANYKEARTIWISNYKVARTIWISQGILGSLSPYFEVPFRAVKWTEEHFQCEMFYSFLACLLMTTRLQRITSGSVQHRLCKICV